MFTPGSPLYGDGITNFLLKNHKIDVIDTPSSMQISLDAMVSYLGNVDYIARNYHYEFIDSAKKFKESEKTIDGSKLNIFNSLTDPYNTETVPTIHLFMKDISSRMNQDDLFLVNTINEYESLLTVLTIKQAQQKIDDFRFSKVPFTVGIITKDIKNDNSRSI